MSCPGVSVARPLRKCSFRHGRVHFRIARCAGVSFRNPSGTPTIWCHAREVACIPRSCIASVTGKSTHCSPKLNSRPTIARSTRCSRTTTSLPLSVGCAKSRPLSASAPASPSASPAAADFPEGRPDKPFKRTAQTAESACTVDNSCCNRARSSAMPERRPGFSRRRVSSGAGRVRRRLTVGTPRYGNTPPPAK